jgi:hypothetical protein
MNMHIAGIGQILCESLAFLPHLEYPTMPTSRALSRERCALGAFRP